MKRKPAARGFGAITLSILVLTILICGLWRGLLGAHADSAPSTIFLDTTPATFSIGTAGSSGTIAYSVTDLSGATINSGQISVSYWQAALTLPREQDGYYVLHVVDHTVSGTSSASQSIPFAIVAPFTTPADSPFGVGVHFIGSSHALLAQLTATMGVGMVRDDAAWNLIEKAPGQYSFSGFDPYMRVLQQDNIDPLLILDYTNRFYDNGQTPYDSSGLAAFASYAQSVVAHYGPQLKAVEVYNEYNGMSSTGPCAHKPACYAQMLRVTYQAIKSIRPDVTVIGGALFSADLSWFGQLFQDGALPYMDAVSDHPYTAFMVTSPEVAETGEQMTKLETLIKQNNHGQPKPIWITEQGWPTSFLHVSERTQADYLVRSAVLSLAAGVQKFFWYDLQNDGSDSYDIEQNFGLLNLPDATGRYTPKPAYVAYAVLARQLANQHFTGGGSIGWGIYDERFTSNLHVLWATPGDRNAVVFTNFPVTVTSMTGRTQIYTPSSGYIVLKLSGDPIYLRGNVARIAWDPPVCGVLCA